MSTLAAMSGDIVLDTHVVLWWQAQSHRLSRRASSRIEEARRLLVSPISIWEVAMLVEKGRIGLDRPMAVWVRDFLATERVELAELTPAIAVGAAQLPSFHGDPADRLITATAMAHGAALVTKDKRIRGYARHSDTISVVW